MLSELEANMVTWRELIAEAMTDTGETIVAIAGNIDDRFHSGYGSPEGGPFTVWTETRVYFPVCYDGAESVASAPRNPCDEQTEHVGSW